MNPIVFNHKNICIKGASGAIADLLSPLSGAYRYPYSSTMTLTITLKVTEKNGAKSETQPRAPLHKTFCQTFFCHKKNSGKISMQIAMDNFFWPEFPDFCRKKLRQKVLCNGALKSFQMARLYIYFVTPTWRRRTVGQIEWG